MMSGEEMKALLLRRARMVEEFLPSCVGGDMPPRLRDSMLYSLQAGGKRLRPVLCLSCAALFGLAESVVLPFAAAIEMIHTYSLIHDDLPAMDDDDLRRGKPSNHKAFDEATAILAGDGLLTDAFGRMTTVDLPASRVLAAVGEMARAAGSTGMVGGQEWDMIYTGSVCGALLAGAESIELQRISRYGAALGVAFQIADDILDVVSDTETLGKPAGSDAEHGKNTYPSLVGLDESRRLAQEQARHAQEAIASFHGPEAEFLRALALYTVTRVA